jgi:hypothetical protein
MPAELELVSGRRLRVTEEIELVRAWLQVAAYGPDRRSGSQEYSRTFSLADGRIAVVAVSHVAAVVELDELEEPERPAIQVPERRPVAA